MSLHLESKPHVSDVQDVNTINTGIRARSTLFPLHMRGSQLEIFQKTLEKDLTLLYQKSSRVTHDNLSLGEKEALGQLKSNSNLVIKMSAKGGAVVVLNSVDYQNEALRQLSEESTYEVLRCNPTSLFRPKLLKLVHRGVSLGIVSSEEATFLLPEHIIIPVFHYLPKVHMSLDHPPGRPIVLGIGSLNEPLSVWVDQYLKPLVGKLPGFLRYTKQVLRQLSELQWRSGMSWVTADVAAHYSSIPHSLALDALRYQFDRFSNYSQKTVTLETEAGGPITIVHILTCPLKSCLICTMLSPAAAPYASAATRCPVNRASCRLRALWLLSLLLGFCQSAENRCSSSSADTCTKCLATGPECGWCTQEDFMVESTENGRCDTVFNLKSKGCRANLIEHPSVQIQVSNTKETNNQVTPGDLSVHLRPGGKVNFMLRVHRLEKYPVDIYYLVDVSASMHKNIEKLNSIGSALSKKMANISHDIRLGFGSFVDKPVSPYISIHPQRIKNQCNYSEIRWDCMPAHGYINVLSLTRNITEFKTVVGKQKLSGNIDAPEGAFDAMLQAAVCHKDIGWRKEAKRLLIVMTDETSHLALDSKLAGIVTPNDGNCHLKDNVYTRSTDMEHPSLGLLGEKLVENHVSGVFAVQAKLFNWYKDLSPLLPGTVVRKLEPLASNMKDLVVDAYQMLLSEVKIQVDNPIKGIHVHITAVCPDGTRRSGMEGCNNVKGNDKVFFNVTITMDSCDVGDGHNYIVLNPIGFNETAKIKIHRGCSCHCTSLSRAKEKCVTEESPECTTAPCNGDNCSTDELTHGLESCRVLPSLPTCSGRGICSCGKCFCHKTKLGNIYGKYCEMDDFSCPYHYGKLCSGNGDCEDGKCKCQGGWEGDRCHCPSSLKEHCVDSKGLVCSGRGTCQCGRCECTDDRSFGPLCQYCTDNWNCEHSQASSNDSEDARNNYCNILVYYIDQTSECFSDPRILTIFFIIFIVTFLLGLLTVLITRVIVLQHHNNRDRSSSDYRVSTDKKDKKVLYSTYARTVTYTPEKPDDINISINKLGTHEGFKYKF
ncbi:integrin beta-8 [Rhinophrynus dorsalis]